MYLNNILFDQLLRKYSSSINLIYTQQTNLAFTAEEAAAEQAWISSLLPEALTRRTWAETALVASAKIACITPRQSGKKLLPFLLQLISGMKKCVKMLLLLPLQHRQDLLLAWRTWWGCRSVCCCSKGKICCWHAEVWQESAAFTGAA